MSSSLGLKIIIVLIAGVATAQAQNPASNFPGKPIRIMAGFSAGSTVDIMARTAGQKMAEAWGQPVIVDNRPSAGGIIAAGVVAKANPDGYTLLSVSAGHAVSAALYKSLPYDTVKDFSGITRFANVPSILIVSPSIGIKSIKELVALAKTKPGTLNYSSPGIGSANHLAGELMKSLAGIDVTHVPFKGIPEALAAGMTGAVTYNLSPIVNVLPLIRAGKIIPLATTTGKRAAALQEVPTLAEAGVKGYVFDPWFGLLVTGKTPRAIVVKLNQEVVRIMDLPDVKTRLAALGAEPATTTPEQFDSHIRNEIEKFRKIIQDGNIRVD
jgi:tripartite-type tricarboxylate transporter receptor subunit TctC